VHFDTEGHIIVSPREIHEMALADKPKLINFVLIPGTPRAIPTHAQHCDLLEHISQEMGVHPNNLLLRGSTKIGFSISPKPAKVWMEFGPSSDLDLAIVDPGFFQVVDYEVGRWERNADNRSKMFKDQRLLQQYRNRVYHKGKFDCFRFFDLPRVASMDQLNGCLSFAPVQSCCGMSRPLNAFVFRDWWGVCKRYDFDLYRLENGLHNQMDPLPAGGDAPRPFEGVMDTEPDELDAGDLAEGAPSD
jgi:hypothetical protein